MTDKINTELSKEELCFIKYLISEFEGQHYPHLEFTENLERCRNLRIKIDDILNKNYETK